MRVPALRCAAPSPLTPASPPQEDAKDILLASLNAADPRVGINQAVRAVSALSSLSHPSHPSGARECAPAPALNPLSAAQVSLSADGSVLNVFETAYTLSDYDDVVVVGAGKASAQMAEAVLDILGERVTKGHVVTKYEHTNAAKTGPVTVTESGHPVPDEPGVEGGRKVMALAEAADERTLFIACMSGGGSALLGQPAEGLTLEDMQETNERLLESGADITLMNTVRKHLSAVKGGQLAMAAAPATIVSLVLSDVIGDPLDSIASGPTVPDTSTFADCWRIVEDFKLEGKLPPAAEARLKAGLAGEIAETPKPGEAVFEKTQTVVVGNNALAVEMAEERARALGYTTLVLSTLVEGEAREVAKVMSAIAKEVPLSGRPVPPPCCIIIGGETTVTLRGAGKGGRNQEIAMAAAREIAGYKGLAILSAGTDGTDGPTDAAGAVVDGGTIARAEAKGIEVNDYMESNDAYNFFKALGDGLLITGPTGTNVADVAFLLVGEQA